MSGRSSERDAKRRVGTGKKFGSDFEGFVDIHLTDQHREELAAWVAPGAVDLGEFLDTLMGDGYKFSLVADVAHNCVIATATGRGDACENKGYCLSARGPDVNQAMVVLWFKIAVIAHWGPWLSEGSVANQQLPLWG